MHYFWESSIKPIMNKFKVKKIIEIGAATGRNTINLLEYCNKVNGTLFVIDPKPLFNENALRLKYGNRLHVLKDLSLQILPWLTCYDAVMIDGDHNWYTVYHELKLIERNAKITGKIPLIFLHDVGWPYGRRDMYYFPKSIPEPYRKPYDRKGIVRGQSKLVMKGGVNSFLYNATFEKGARNGVLTAIEDFLRESELAIRFDKVNDECGLGILIPLNR